MAEKTLKTRIALKYDTLENWTNSTIGLMPGEVAIAHTSAELTSGAEEPVIIVRIGEDGVKKFS